MLGAVGDVGLDGAAGAVGPQHSQGVVAGRDGLLGHGAGLVLIRLALISIFGGKRGMRFRHEGVGGVDLLAPPAPPGPRRLAVRHVSSPLFEQLLPSRRGEHLAPLCQIQPETAEKTVQAPSLWSRRNGVENVH